MRKKADYTDLPPFIEYFRVKRTDGLKGTRYLLDRNVTQDDIDELMARFRNVTYCLAWYRYAPEIKHFAVVLWDKCIRCGGVINEHSYRAI